VSTIEVDVWVRGTEVAKTRQIQSVPGNADDWSEGDVRQLLSEMLLAIEREKNPGGEAPSVTLRGFSWIVSPWDSGGVVLHLEMQMGTASAGPFAIDEARLTRLVSRAIEFEKDGPSERVH
jgi:hypothetical protein